MGKKYIAIEGIDTAGKSTQINLLKQTFPNAIFTKEPGGTKIGSEIREMVLNGKVGSKAGEMFLFLADRAEHTKEIIKPNNKMIISDRSLVSGIAYANDLQIERLIELNLMATQNILPTHIILLFLQKEDLEKRLSQKNNDAIEARGVEYLYGIQRRMVQVLGKLKTRHLILNATFSIERIQKDIEDFINEK